MRKTNPPLPSWQSGLPQNSAPFPIPTVSLSQNVRPPSIAIFSLAILASWRPWRDSSQDSNPFKAIKTIVPLQKRDCAPKKARPITNQSHRIHASRLHPLTLSPCHRVIFSVHIHP